MRLTCQWRTSHLHILFAKAKILELDILEIGSSPAERQKFVKGPQNLESHDRADTTLRDQMPSTSN